MSTEETGDWWEEYELEVYDSKKKKWRKEKRYSKCILSPEHSYFLNLIDRKPAIYLGKRLMRKKDWGRVKYLGKAGHNEKNKPVPTNEIYFDRIKCDSGNNEFAIKIKFV